VISTRDPIVIGSCIAQTFLQLVLFSIIMACQDQQASSVAK
jgi:hypothetical protein